MRKVKTNSYFNIIKYLLLLIFSIIFLFFIINGYFPLSDLTFTGVVGIIALIAAPFYSVSQIIKYIKKIQIYNAEIKDQSILKPDVRRKYLVEENDEINEKIKSRKHNNWYWGAIGSISLIAGLWLLLANLDYYSTIDISEDSLIFVPIGMIFNSIFFSIIIIYNIYKTKYDKKVIIKNEAELEELELNTNTVEVIDLSSTEKLS